MIDAREDWAATLQCGWFEVLHRNGNVLLSWQPHAEDDPAYPGFTIDMREAGCPTETAGETLEWVEAQPWANTCKGDYATVHLKLTPSEAEPRAVPPPELPSLRAKAAEFGWLLGVTLEPEGRFSWAVYDAATGERLQHGKADAWDDAKIAAVLNLMPPSQEGMTRSQ